MLLNENKSNTSGPPYYVNVDVKSGESLAIQLFDGNKQLVNGPATLTMLSHTTYPPMPLPLNLPPGHSMQQIVDENGVLKHIIIGSPSSSDQMSAKNQIFSKNGTKLTSHLNGTRLSSFKKKLSPTTGNHNESTTYNKSNRFNGLTNDPLINSATGLLNSSNLVYPVCCYCCPDCMPNNQVNSNSMNPFPNELGYDRPVNFSNYSINQTSAVKSMTNNNYSRRTSANNSFPAKIGRGDKLENGRLENYRNDNSRKESINRNENNGIGKNGLKSHKIGTNKTILLNSNLSNYSSAAISSNQPAKSALLGNRQVCKQCISQEHYSNNYMNPSTYHSNSYNQKYLYPTPFVHASSYQTNNHSNHYRIANKSIQQQKYSHASDATKQSSNKNQRASKTNYHNLITQPSSQTSLLNAHNNPSKDPKVYPPTSSQQESDSYSELIRYVNSNHISAFKSHKRINLDTSKLNHLNNTQPAVVSKERATSNSVTASSSPISEHYDFSSEESEQIAYKHTTLLDYPTNYSPNYEYSYSSNNYSNGSSTNSSLNSSTAINNQPLRVHKILIKNESEMNEKNSEECTSDNLKIETSKLISNDEKDDGYEDDFELKNCDSKSNDDVIIENKVIKEIIDQQAIDKSSQDKLEDVVLERQENKLDHEVEDEMNEVRDDASLIQQIDLCDVIECDTIIKSNSGASPFENEKILDENSNEIDNVDRNDLAGKRLQIIEFTDFLQEEPEAPTSKDDSNVRLTEENVKSDSDESNTMHNSIKQEAIKPKKVNRETTTQEVTKLILPETTNQETSKESPITTSKKKPETIKIVSFALSYTKLTGNHVKLKWTVLNNGNNLYAIAKENQFMVEMIYWKAGDSTSNERDKTANKASRIVFTGLVKHCKVQCLKPLEEYSFRVKLMYNDYQLISNLLTITTPECQVQSMIGKKRTGKHNLQFSLQQQQILKQQQIIIEQKERELSLKQSQLNQQQTSSSSSSLFTPLCAIGSLFKENFAYLLIIFFSISAFFFANFLSKDLI